MVAILFILCCGLAVLVLFFSGFSGQGNVEGGSGGSEVRIGVGFGADITAVHFDDSISDSQSKSGAFPDLFGAEERFEDFGEIFGWDSGAGIGNAKDNIFGVFLDGESDSTALRHGGDGIGGKVGYDLDNLVGVEVGDEIIGLGIYIISDVIGEMDNFKSTFDEVAHVSGLKGYFVLSGEMQ